MRRMAEAAAVPPKGVWRFLGKNPMRGWLWGSRGRQGPGDCMPYHTEYGYYLAGIVPLP
jgi:hypothetical protein